MCVKRSGMLLAVGARAIGRRQLVSGGRLARRLFVAGWVKDIRLYPTITFGSLRVSHGPHILVAQKRNGFYFRCLPIFAGKSSLLAKLAKLVLEGGGFG